MSTVTATLFGPDGKPLAGVPLQLSMAVSQTPIDWGYLSSRTLYTDSTGQAKVVYYSPVMTGFFAGTPGQQVEIIVDAGRLELLDSRPGQRPHQGDAAAGADPWCGRADSCGNILAELAESG